MVCFTKFAVQKLDITHPKSLEVIWALVRTKGLVPAGHTKEFIVCSFYSPPKKGKHSKLSQHIVENIIVLLRKFPKVGVLIAGDANRMEYGHILRSAPHFRQLVTKATHAGGVLDIIITNIQPKYTVPIIRPPARPDNPGLGRPSDHSFAVAVPIAGTKKTSREYRIRETRPTPDSARREFGRLLLSVSWDYIEMEGSPT